MPGHLIHIGYPKTASTLLQLWFARHPALAYAETGLAGFHNVYDVCRQSAAPAPEIRYRVTSCEALATPHGEVGHLISKRHRERPDEMPDAQARACRILHELFPTAHVLLVTRGFRSIILSGYSQYVREGGQEDFYAFRPPSAAPATGEKNVWNYDYLIGLYRAAFGDRLIVLPYELLRDDAGAFFAELEKRLGLDPFAPPAERPNASLSPVELRWYPRMTRLVRRLPLGDRIRSAVLRRYIPAVEKNRFRRLIGLLQHVRPAQPVTIDLVSDEAVNYFRGRADLLRGDPLYAPYAADYLLDRPTL
ncbi:MAG: sulfotransferase [Pseudomonadota bacterium]|nr:sulfotransferase [Pseudomonadota bacterium]